MDRANWTAYANFMLMCDNVRAEMVEDRILVEFDEPVWMDARGNIFEEKYDAGFKVTHDIAHPDFFLVADELGGNESQKGDGHVGGTRLLCERGLVSKKISSNQDKHFDLISFTALNGNPVVRIVKFLGVN